MADGKPKWGKWTIRRSGSKHINIACLFPMCPYGLRILKRKDSEGKTILSEIQITKMNTHQMGHDIDKGLGGDGLMGMDPVDSTRRLDQEGIGKVAQKAHGHGRGKGTPGQRGNMKRTG